MSRWQIKSVLFYSHDSRLLQLDFALSKLTIIVGESYSGKSAIIESIDYVMGSTKSHIPGVVAETCSWVGVVWAKDKSEIIMCRKLPPLLGKSTDDVYIDKGFPVAIPPTANDLSKKTTADGALRIFEQSLLLGEVIGLTFTARQGTRISARYAMPYVLISDDVIIDKINLLRGMSEWRQGLIDSAPYFLGAVDETTVKTEQRLKKLRAQLTKEEARRGAATLANEETVRKAKELLAEAAEVGLIANADVEAVTIDNIKEALEAVAEWTPALGAAPVGADRLTTLYAQEREILSSLSSLNESRRVANDAIKAATTFTDTAGDQRARLDIAKLFKSEAEVDACPVCNAALNGRTPALEGIQAALNRLDGELKEAEQDRPQIDGYILELSNQIDVATTVLKNVRAQIVAIIREAQNKSKRLDIDPRRMRIAGRVSFYLESLTNNLDTISDEKFAELKAEIEYLAAQVDPDAKDERIDALQSQVSTTATAILRELPFDQHYRTASIMFEARKLASRFVIGPRVMEMRDVGGDESYLSGRISTLLALHRTFDSGNRPVPGVLIFDQISRPFYLQQTQDGKPILKSKDLIDLKRYFDRLFDEVDEQSTLQVIVLEHAYMGHDERYINAVKPAWNPDGKLIPEDWPRTGIDGL
ncbi:MAG: hypothetical protein C0483_21605 [Pirellula sp.]|nr:hypothetical protein [Pirellula sp.]